MKPRGRPRRDDTLDVVIAKTCEKLILWGFSGEAIYAAVAHEARSILGRSDSYSLPLSADRIEQIHKKLSSKIRWKYTKTSLYERCPNKMATVQELASTLLKHKGDWPRQIHRVRLLDGSWEERGGSGIIHGDLELSPKRQDQLTKANAPRISRGKPDHEK